MDQRIPNGELVHTQFLMNGSGIPQIRVNAPGNYWSDNPLYPLARRFGNLNVTYIPYNPEPCILPSLPGPQEMVISSSNGTPIDTIYSTGENVTDLTTLDLSYSAAKEKFLTGNVDAAEIRYQNIISGDYTIEEKLSAYQKLYEAATILNRDENYFTQLRNLYINLSDPDSIISKIIKQLQTLSLIGRHDFVSALNEFDEIVQNTNIDEEASYAELDALGTSLFLQGDSLGKTINSNYLTKNGAEYYSRVKQLLYKFYGKNSSNNNCVLLPNSYSLEQNHPNPFNPTTTINYQMPKSGIVSLKVYDILGREVITLVNEQKSPGKYSANFDASKLSSGVYIYQIRINDYVCSKKMMLVK